MPAPQSCLIVGRFLSSVVDSPEDPDRDPDIVPIAVAKVTLTASVARVRASSAEPPATGLGTISTTFAAPSTTALIAAAADALTRFNRS